VVVGDGEAETGPLATAWHSNKFLDPVTDGAVLAHLHLNGYKIANPRCSRESRAKSWINSCAGMAGTPYFVAGHEPQLMHESMASTPDVAIEQIRSIQQHARDRKKTLCGRAGR
jgi:xylulose-5-phosphate/fructose-6-phosphate phosphoketolase